MIISKELFNKAAEEKKQKAIQSYHIDDGEHEGVIYAVDYNAENGRVYLKIQLSDGTPFKSSTELADWSKAPMSVLADYITDDNGDLDTEKLIECQVTFETSTKTAKDGTPFSNIMKIAFIYSDEDDAESINE